MKNEEENIPRLLKSVEGCFDQIVLVDTGSTDKSVEVAKSLGVQVEYFKWVDDFSAARNYSFSFSKSEFTMWLDLDDVLFNREGFINFRDTVMHMADYWVAAYHYGSDGNGKVTCSFSRERIVRTNKNYRWKYFVHEGIIPTTECRMQFTQVWAVTHKRTAEDIVKDKSRNLALFESRVDQLDSRELYYYGKELFENNRAADAIQYFSKGLKDPNLQMHDRILAMQYLAQCYINCNQNEQAMQICMQGSLLIPNRAEFYTMLADCYIRQNKLIDAIPHLGAAKYCTLPTNNSPTAIFHSEEAYTVIPRLNLAKIYAQIGDFEKAEKEAAECVEKWGHSETKLVLEEIRKVKKITEGYKTAKPCEDIVILCPPQGAYIWDKDLVKTRNIGGSEIAAIEMADWLHKKSGRPVKVFNVRDSGKTCDGVEYIPATMAAEYMSKHRPFLAINWRHNVKLTNAPTFIWSHDLATHGAEVIENYEKIMCLTPFHKRHMMATQGVPEDKIYLTRNGLNPDRFSPIDHSKKDPNKFIFSSSPDRGLDRAMLVLDKVREKYPDIKLNIFYGWEHLDNYGLKDLRIKLEAMLAERKDWVTYHGATPQGQLMKEFETAAYCVQPSDWIETSMISAMEQLCSGVYQIRRAVGGCVDTMRPAVEVNMATLVDSDCITPDQYQLYVDATIKAIDEQAYKRIKGKVADPNTYAWELVAEQWLKDLPKIAYGDLPTLEEVVHLKHVKSG